MDRKYIYVLWSKHFDIDGEDTLYKVGMSKKIEERKYNSCYTTAFKYPCMYKQWYEITSKHSVHFCEAVVKDALKKYKAREEIFNEDNVRIDKGGSEMFNINIKKLTLIIEDVFNGCCIKYKKFTEDKFIRPHHQITDEFLQPMKIKTTILDDYKTVNSINKKIINNEKFTKKELDFVSDLTWSFNHHDKNTSHRCCICNRTLQKKSFIIVNIEWGITAYTGSTCIHKIPNLKYISRDVHDKIKECGYHNPTNVIINSDKNINNVLMDPCQVIYSYSLLSGNDEVSCANIKPDEEWRVIGMLPKYDPRGLCCAIITWMYRNNNTFCTIQDISVKIKSWNVEKKMYWGINALISYIQNENCGLVYVEDEQRVIYKKYYDMEVSIVNNVKKLNKRKPEPLHGIHEFIETIKDDANKKYTNPNIEAIDNQMKTLKHINNNTISVLTGVAGSGKSETSSYIAKFMKSQGYNVIQLAPTGKAASVISKKNEGVGFKHKAYTIHSRLYRLVKTHEKTFIHCDEFSMCDTEIVYKLFNILSTYDNIKILITGDENQIPPVGFGSPFIHLQTILKTSHNHLTENLRTDNITIQSFNKWYLSVMKEGPNIRYNLRKIIQRTKFDVRPKSDIKIIKYNTNEIIKLKNNGYDFITHKNDVRKEIINIIKDKTIEDVSRGDKIMILKNGYTGGEMVYYNGQETIVKNNIYGPNGNIIGFDGYDVDNEKKDIRVCFTEKHQTLNLRDLICYSDCNTIHKSQGSGFSKICLVLKEDTNIDYNIIYTAITRCEKELVIMYDDIWEQKDIFKTPRVYNTELTYLVSEEKYTPTNENTQRLKQKVIDVLGDRYITYSMKWKIHTNMRLNEYDLNKLKKLDKDGYMNYDKFVKLYKIYLKNN